MRSQERVLEHPGLIQGVAVSPDSRHAALEIDAANANIWILDMERGGLSRLTFRGRSNFPHWSPDGEWLYYSASRGGLRAIYRSRVDGSGDAELVFGVADTDLVMVDLETGEASEYLATRCIDASPAISPQGAWIAYASDERGSELRTRADLRGTQRGIAIRDLWHCPEIPVHIVPGLRHLA